jgi:hypothetical protein
VSRVRVRGYWPVTQHWAWCGPHRKHLFCCQNACSLARCLALGRYITQRKHARRYHIKRNQTFSCERHDTHLWAARHTFHCVISPSSARVTLMMARNKHGTRIQAHPSSKHASSPDAVSRAYETECLCSRSWNITQCSCGTKFASNCIHNVVWTLSIWTVFFFKRCNESPRYSTNKIYGTGFFMLIFAQVSKNYVCSCA